MRFVPDGPTLLFSEKMLDLQDVNEGFSKMAAEPANLRASKIGIISVFVVLFGGMASMFLGFPFVGFAIFGIGMEMLGIFVLRRSRQISDRRGGITGGILMILLGLTFLVPLPFAPILGDEGVYGLYCGSWFLIGGLFLFYVSAEGNIRGIPRRGGITVEARCIGYVFKTGKTRRYHGYSVAWLSEVFAYSIDGVEYRAFSSQFHTKPLCIFGNVVDIQVNPKDPEDIRFQKESGVKPRNVFTGVFLASISCLIGIMAFFSVYAQYEKLKSGPNEPLRIEQKTQLVITDASIKEDIGSEYSDFEIEFRIVTESAVSGDGYSFTFSNGEVWQVSAQTWGRLPVVNDYVYFVLEPGTQNILAMYPEDDCYYEGVHEIKNCLVNPDTMS